MAQTSTVVYKSAPGGCCMRDGVADARNIILETDFTLRKKREEDKNQKVERALKALNDVLERDGSIDDNELRNIFMNHLIPGILSLRELSEVSPLKKFFRQINESVIRIETLAGELGRANGLQRQQYSEEALRIRRETIALIKERSPEEVPENMQEDLTRLVGTAIGQIFHRI